MLTLVGNEIKRALCKPVLIYEKVHFQSANFNLIVLCVSRRNIFTSFVAAFIFETLRQLLSRKAFCSKSNHTKIHSIFQKEERISGREVLNILLSSKILLRVLKVFTAQALRIMIIKQTFILCILGGFYKKLLFPEIGSIITNI